MSALTIPFRYADNLPLIPDASTVAYIIDIATGELWDEAGNYESAINYVQTGDYLAVACADERHWCSQEDCLYCATYGPIVHSQADMQAGFDRERALYEDCFEAEAVA